MIGYKAFDKDLSCMGFKYEVGKTYTKDTKKEDLKCCTNKVFHFCRELFAIEKESDYKLSESRICEIIAGDFVRSGDKYGTNSIYILREIEGDEKLELINSGNRNSGDWNSGNRNSGDGNSGNCNSGKHNSGKHNSGDWNSGFFNSTNSLRIFNKKTKKTRDEIDFPNFLYFSLTVWVSHDTATEEEKKEHEEEIKVYGGFMKTLGYKEAFRLAWDKANKKEHKKMLDLPNWDNEVFKEISGIDAEAEIAKEEV